MWVFVGGAAVASIPAHSQFVVGAEAARAGDASGPSLLELVVVVQDDKSARVVARAGVRGLAPGGKLTLRWPSGANEEAILPEAPARPVEAPAVVRDALDASLAETGMKDTPQPVIPAHPARPLAAIAFAKSEERDAVMIDAVGNCLVRVAPTTSWLGETEPGYQVTRRQVQITRAFWIARTEVTQAQFQSVMGTNPSQTKGDTLPVTDLLWLEATQYCDRLTSLTGVKYRLPTDAEWEIACRAGTSTAWCFGNDSSKIQKHAWTSLNSGGRPHPVGEKLPNPLGLYDMYGNVREWCSDWYVDAVGGLQVDPTGPTEEVATRSAKARNEDSASKCVRGGCFTSPDMFMSSAMQFGHTTLERESYVGFRVVMEVPASGVIPKP